MTDYHLDLQIWYKICETYDTSLLDKLSPEVKKILEPKLDDAFEQYDNTNVFGGLAHIIYNHLYPPASLKYDYLSGPVKLTVHYSEKYKKYIYIFGEIHIKNEKCLEHKHSSTMANFLSNVVRNSDKFIDIFIEQPILHRETTKLFAGGIIGDITDKFGSSCTEIEKTCWNYPNLRYHYTDIRKNTSDHLLYLIHVLLRPLTEGRLYGGETLDNIIKLYEDNQKYFKDVTTLITEVDKRYKNFKLEKQLEHIKNNDVKTKLIQYIEHNINMQANKDNSYNIALSLEKMIDILKMVKKQATSDNVESLLLKTDIIKHADNLYMGMLKSLVYYMDMYLLARLFREFKSKRGFNSHEPKYVIIYAGNSHAEHYREFLKILDFDMLKEIKVSNKYDNCIDIRELNQPLFPLYIK